MLLLNHWTYSVKNNCANYYSKLCHRSLFGTLSRLPLPHVVCACVRGWGGGPGTPVKPAVLWFWQKDFGDLRAACRTAAVRFGGKWVYAADKWRSLRWNSVTLGCFLFYFYHYQVSVLLLTLSPCLCCLLWAWGNIKVTYYNSHRHALTRTYTCKLS